MRIAFADITDYVEFKGKTVPMVHNGVAVTMENPKTGECVPVTRTVNVVRLKDSAHVDGQLINEISEGREGSKIKLADRQKSLDFLARYFELFPMDRHRVEYDRQRLEIERLKQEAAQTSDAEALKSLDAVLARIGGNLGAVD
jgi:phage terminase small subunit